MPGYAMTTTSEWENRLIGKIRGLKTASQSRRGKPAMLVIRITDGIVQVYETGPPERLTRERGRGE